MRRRSSTVALAATGLVLFSSVGNASLEADCFVAGGYFGPAYMQASYLDESCLPPDPPSPVSSDNDLKNLFRFPDNWD